MRSGGAEAADTAFEEGAGDYRKSIYLPWNGFNNHWDGLVVGNDPRLRDITVRHYTRYYRKGLLRGPAAWETIESEGVRRLHTRNAAQIVGHTEPVILSDFVLCWTPRAKGGGGTGQAIRIANFYEVPVYDLADPQNTFETDWL